MKIGIVSPYYMHRPGGVQTILKELKPLLEKRGHQVSIISPRPNRKIDIDNTPEDVILLGQSKEIKFRAPFHTTHPLSNISNSELERFNDEYDFDVLNVHEPWMPMFAYQMVNNAMCPVVGTLHARWPRSLVNKSIEKARAPYVRSTMKKLSAITAVSSVAAKNAYEVDEDAEVMIVPNGLHVGDIRAKYRAFRNKDEPPYILFLNRLETRKGPMHLLKAYQILDTEYPDDTPRLIFAGGGPLEEKLKEYALKHDLDKVEFEGFVSEDRKNELFSNATVYASPAPYGESFGIVLLEAMAAGVPVVAGDNEGYKTVLKDEGALSLVDPRQHAELADRLKVMCDNIPVRKAWINWASKAVERYDFLNIVQEYEAAYMKALKK